MVSNSRGAVTAAAVFIGVFTVVLLLSPIAVEPAYGIKSNQFGKYIDLVGDSSFEGVFLDERSPSDILSLRSWNTKAFFIPETDEIKWRVYQNRIHFFDGENWVDLNRLSYPKLEKKEFLLEEKPPLQENLTRFKVDNYLLHKGITAEINPDNEIIFKDAKQAEIIKISLPLSIDSKQNIITGEYKILQEGQELQIFADIRSEWLQNAQYPIVIDPDANYSGSKADAGLTKSDSTYQSAQTVVPTVESVSSTGVLVGQSWSDEGPIVP